MRKWIPALLVAGAYALSLAVYTRLPAAVAFDASRLLPFATGDANETLPRVVAAFLLPTIALAIWGLLHEAPTGRLGRASARLWGAPAIDGAAEYGKYAPTYRIIVAWAVSLVLAVHVAMLSGALGWPLHPGTLVGATFGAGMVLIGNLMPRLRPNRVAGVRTASTMRDPQLWARVHRRYGTLWMLGGVAALAVAFAAPTYALATSVAVILVSSLAMLGAPRAMVVASVVAVAMGSAGGMA